MQKFFLHKKFLICLSALLLSGFLYAETFRTAKCHIINLKEDTDFSATEKLGLNDTLAIFIPENRNFLDGIEIKMDIPEQVAVWRDCCAAYVYENIKPVPSKDQIDFSGNKVFFGVLPGKLSWILQIPLKSDVSFKTNQYSKTIEKIPDVSGNFVFLRIQQIMKGVPEEVMNSSISFTVRPILNDKGLLNINFTTPQSESQNESQNNELTDTVSVFINDSPFDSETVKKGILLNTGIHNITVISENYRTEVRKVRIDQAKIIPLDIELKSIDPTVIITAPEGSTVYINDELFEDLGKEVIFSEGDYKIRCGIGDYEIIRSLAISKGHTYKVNLTVDLQIQEDE